MDESELAFKSTETNPIPPPSEVVRPVSIIHTTKMPTTDVVLDVALAHFDTHTISPWTNPVEWIEVESNYVHGIISRLAMLIQIDKSVSLVKSYIRQI
jgi:hypothetical protein